MFLFELALNLEMEKHTHVNIELLYLKKFYDVVQASVELMLNTVQVIGKKGITFIAITFVVVEHKL
mgnify:CR=1 FL=1